MNRPTRILAGTARPGGATCLFPVVRELERRSGVEVQTLAQGHAALVFRENGVAFSEVEDDRAEMTVRATIRRFAPDVILSGVFGPIEGGLDFRLIRAAARKGIRSFGVLDAWMNYAMRFADPENGDPLAYLPDEMAVMDEETVAELAALGVPSERVRVTGHPFVPMVRRRAEDRPVRIAVRRRLHIGREERLIVFFSEPLRWGAERGLNEHAGYDEFTAFELLTAALHGCDRRDVLAVREHPRHASLAVPDRIGPVRVVRGEGIDVLNLILGADVVVGMSTTVLVYAYLSGRTVLVLQPGLRRGRDRSMLTRRGILANLQTPDEVRAGLARSHGNDAEKRAVVRRALGWHGRADVAAAGAALELLNRSPTRDLQSIV